MRKLLLVFVGLLMTVSLSAQEVSFHFTDGIYNAALKSRMERNASTLLTEINQAAEQNRPLRLNGKVGMEAAERLNMLWESFGFVCQSNAKSICYGLTSGYQARGIQATVTRQPEDCSDPMARELTISFDKYGNITSVGFALVNNQITVLNEEDEVLDNRKRNEILKFVEDFRNYYNEKDIVSLRKIFSEDALIITGRVETRKESGDFNSRMKKKITYTKQDKETYLRNLSNLFRNNGYIDVQFEDILVSGANSSAMENCYGVYLTQHWKSKNKMGGKYEDTGYLFLLWDFNEEPPVIHVRAWQPAETPDDELYTTDDFR